MTVELTESQSSMLLDESKAYFKLLDKHLNEASDVTLILIKGHLLIEEIVDDLIRRSLCHPSALNEAKLNFHSKLCLLHALIMRTEEANFDKWIIAIKKLNIIRNKVSHHLEYSELNKLIEEFISLYMEIYREISPMFDYLNYRNQREMIEERLKFAIKGLVSSLLGVRLCSRVIEILDNADS